MREDPFALVAELPGVPEAVQEARQAVDRLYGHRILRRRSPEVSVESALRGARASAALEGIVVTLSDLRAGTGPGAEGALRVSAELGRLGGTWRTAPRQALARLHALAVAGHPGVDPGRPRTDLGQPIDDVHGLGPAPDPQEAAARIGALAELLIATKAPAVVVGAIAHAELAALRPFGTADGIVARAAERLTLVERGLDPKSLVAVEVGHLELGDAYAEGLRAYLSGTSEGVAAWIVHCASAVVLGVRETMAVCEALSR
ncbi:Fic family protein [Streptosporangiaceae bacterium NEAU-GS5]|nr:Fic family protein [Streptosporangiaceae bacterium NEAU-GS5]